MSQDAVRRPLLQVRDLRTSFLAEDGEIKAVNDVSFDIQPGSTLGVVGESGCGKSVTGLSIMRLVRSPGRIVSGSIDFEGDDLLAKSDAEMREIRGNRIAMIFQEPMTALNPIMRIGDQVAEVVRTHRRLTRAAARREAREMLANVGIPEPARRYRAFPHQLSGGMRQRVMIAMALVCRPVLVIADEPTTALDVTVQAQILDLMRTLQRDFGMAMILITHDLGVVAQNTTRVIVMYAGVVVEEGPTQGVMHRPAHPYTRALIGSIPGYHRRGARLRPIPGAVPEPGRLPRGCAFHTRCGHAVPGLCDVAMPPMQKVAPDRTVRCVRWRDVAAVP